MHEREVVDLSGAFAIISYYCRGRGWKMDLKIHPPPASASYYTTYTVQYLYTIAGGCLQSLAAAKYLLQQSRCYDGFIHISGHMVIYSSYQFRRL